MKKQPAILSAARDLDRRDSSVALRPQHDSVVDIRAIRAQFPILSRTMRGRPLVYLDNASTTQKPRRVIDAETRFYETVNANVHRGVYELSEEATGAYVAAHEAVARFIGASSAEEIVFVRNTTEGINLLVWSWALQHVRPGDRILLTAMEHHSNIVPWQAFARGGRATLEYVELAPDGNLDLEDLDRKLARRPKIVSLTHVSNVLGTVNPIAEITRRAHAVGAVVIVDAAQSVSRFPVNVRELDIDFLVFSGHKIYGPTGIGVVYGKREHLGAMGPFLTGGDMVKTVTRDSATWNDLPWKFEAGTPNISGGVALGETVRFLEDLGRESIWRHEQELVRYTLPKLQSVPGLRILGPAERAGIFSFTLDGIHSHDLATFLDARGVAIRGGHHCAQPLLTTLGLTECARASVGVYTTADDIDQLINALGEARAALT